MTFPLIVKSLTQEASIGISQASVVDDEAKLRERVQFIHESIQTDAIVEQYVEGRELYCGVARQPAPAGLPGLGDDVREDAGGPAPHRDRAREVECRSTRRRWASPPARRRTCSPELAARVQHISKRAYKVLELSGYARIDLRLDAAGDVYVLEANPNPQIARTEDFADSAARAGMDYPTLLQRILTTGLRWEPERLG